ncbi:MAG: putative transaldolase [Candidatus Woesearchaeota archaeon]|nr:putative transaldolase [Candidatus Woesearchaeota archaeon]
MQIFIDTANLREIIKANQRGIVDGCTTNPMLVAKENVPFKERMREILKVVQGDVSIEVTTNDPEEMVKEATKYANWGENVAIKIPMGMAGLKATKTLTDKGIKTNVTACMTMHQAVLAAKSGATYVSLFWGRIEDLGFDAQRVMEDTVKAFEKHKFDSKIIVGSIRQMSHINRAIQSGAHILTIPPALLDKMAFHPRTESTIKEFLDTWEEYQRVQKLD